MLRAMAAEQHVAPGARSEVAVGHGAGLEALGESSLGPGSGTTGLSTLVKSVGHCPPSTSPNWPITKAWSW